MTFPQTTAQIASVLALLQVILMMLVVRNRFQTQIGIGFGDNNILERRIRVHGNFIENVPIFLILLGLLEMLGMTQGVIAGLGFLFLLLRIAHALGLSKTSKPHPLRVIGATGTVLCLVGAASMLLWQTWTM